MSLTADTAKTELLTKDLPDPIGANRFFNQLLEKHCAEAVKLLRPQNESLLADVLTLAAYSPFLATTMLQHPDYINWLGRKRKGSQIRGRDELLEALARFSLTNSTVSPQILLARFRRRELLRIYLRDIRAHGTIVEITEELSNLADACLEYALRLARQELDNRYGVPLETDARGKTIAAKFCVFALGKLGSCELNYASDVDLMFVYSANGATSGTGTNGAATTNREYFVKLAERTSKIIGEQTGEGSAYRVDLRLRPHGRIGALAVSLEEAVKYYRETAQAWERQALIRSRAAAGDAAVFRLFWTAVEEIVYDKDETVPNALRNVQLSKQKINREHQERTGFNVKLGRGGIREIEFIAQALQLAYGGRDEWLHAPHTIISLTRLAEHKLLSEAETTKLIEAYTFLRRLEHRLQMEYGLQTHLLPSNAEEQKIIARRMGFSSDSGQTEFAGVLQFHCANVSEIFARVFSNAENSAKREKISEVDANVVENEIVEAPFGDVDKASPTAPRPIFQTRGDVHTKAASPQKSSAISPLTDVSEFFGAMIRANPNLVDVLSDWNELQTTRRDYQQILLNAVSSQSSYHNQLAILRTEWTRLFLEIGMLDVANRMEMYEANLRQTELAEAALEAAILIARRKLNDESDNVSKESMSDFGFGVLGLGRLGGRGMDYGSDLDLIFVRADNAFSASPNRSPAQIFARTVEIITNALSGLMREGYLYRVDLRLRPDGRSGATSIGKTAFFEYLQNRAEVWELLAYVKLRAAAGDSELVNTIESRAREIIHERAQKMSAATLRIETKRVRDRLEAEKTQQQSGGGSNIKYGAGGMLDVYFIVRFLQLLKNVPDRDPNRSTRHTLAQLHQAGALNNRDFAALTEGYDFLRELDHNLRLTVGRSTRLPTADHPALTLVARRLGLDTTARLSDALNHHRTQIRAAYNRLLV